MSERALSPVLPEAAPARKKSGELSTRRNPPREGAGTSQAAAGDSARSALNGDFCLFQTNRSDTAVLDEDEAREWMTRWLLNELAPALGVDPSKIEIRVNGEAAARTSARGATGVVENGSVYLHPGRYRPETEEGRALLAHEVAHAAQTTRRPRTPIETPRARENAEREAGRVARAFAKRRPLRHLGATLPANAVAADTGLNKKLEQAVATSRSREIDIIRGLISGLWISDGDVFGVLRVLATMDFAVARAVVHALGRKGRYELCDNINTVHLERMRKQVFACYAALEDNEFGAIDDDVLAEGPMAGLDREEKKSALRTVQHLKERQKRKLLRSVNRLEIKSLIHAPEFVPEDPKAIAEQEKQILENELALVKQREEIGRLREDPGTDQILNELKEILNNSEREPSRNALIAVDYLGPRRSETSRFLAVAERMETDGLIDKILRHLPEGRYLDTADHAETLVALMRSRLPVRNIAFVEDLLSYGLFDWAVRDYEAKFAYRIIKLLPLSEQYRFRQRANGKWYMRLVQNLPKEFTSSKDFRGDIEVRKASKEEIAALKEQNIRTEGDEFFDAAQLYDRKRKEAGVSEEIEALKKAFEEARQSDKPEEAYEDLHRRLAVIGNPSLNKGNFRAADRVRLAAVVHALDRLGYIEKLFSELPESFLFSEVSRIATVKIMMARDPARVQYHARELASRGFLDWMVTDREAYLAYLLVKALPDDERAAFLKHDSEVWGDILGEMSRDMRDSKDLNVYIGDKEGKDRGSVLGELAEASTWTKESAARLDGLLRMAIAMTEHKFAFERSREFAAYKNKDLKPLVDKYRLYDPAESRTKYTPEILKGTKWYEEGLFATLRTIWKGLVFLFNNNFLLVTRSAGAVNLNLNEAQDVLGGDIGGFKLADPERKFNERNPNPESNRLTVLYDVGAHALRLRIPDLRIESVSFQAAGQTIQTGSIHLRGLEADVAYDTDEATQPTKARLDVESLELRDMLVSFRTSMVAVNRFFLSMLHLGAGAVDTSTPNKSAPRPGYYFPVPFLSALGTAIYYLFKFKGWGTEKPGLEMAHGAEQIRAIDLTFSSLEVDGLTTSGGQSVARVAVTAFALRAGLNKTTMLRAKIQSLDRRIASAKRKQDTSGVAKLEAEKAQAREDLAVLVKSEQRLLEIQNRILHGDLTPKEEKRLKAEIAKLDLESKGGLYLDIGSIEASGISGTVQTKSSIKLTDIHGEGTTPAAASSLGISIVTDAELISQVTKGERPKSVAEQAGDFRLELGDFHAEELSVGHGIRTSADIDKKLKELEPVKDKYEFAPLYDYLKDLRLSAVRYEQYLAIGVSSLSQEQLDDFQKLRQSLEKDPDVVFGAIDLQKAYLGVDSSGSVSIGAAVGTLKDVRLPERGIHVDEVKAVDVRANASVKGGLAGWLNAKKNIQGGGLSAQSITITGARSDYQGLLARKITLTGRDAGEKLKVQVDERGDSIEVGLSLSAEGLGLVPRIGLLKRRLAGLKRKDSSDSSKKTKDEIAKLSEDIVRLEGLAETRAKAYALLAKAKTPEEIETAKQAVLEADGIIALSLKQYSAARVDLEGLGAKVTGAGDVFTDMFGDGVDPMKVLERGVNVAGTGPDKTLFRKFSVSGAQVESDQPDSSVGVGLGSFEIGATKLDVSARKQGDSILVDVPKFEIASISLNQFLLTSETGSKGVQLWSTGASGMEKMEFSGSVRLDAKTPGATELSEFRLAHAHIQRFRIKKIFGNGLGFASIGDRFEVDIKSGSINGVHADDLSIDLPADPKAPPVLRGKTGIDSIDNVAIGRAIAGAWTVNRGTINAKKIGVEFLQEGGVKASLGDLSLRSFSVRGPDGWARFSLSNLGGKFLYQDGKFVLEDVHLGSFDVSAIHWKIGKKGFIEADQPARIVDVRLKGAVETEKVPAKAKPGETVKPGETETRLKRISIKHFHVGNVSAEHLVYQDEENRIELKPWDKSMPKHMKGFRPMFLQNLDVTDLTWDAGAGFVAGKAELERYEGSVIFEGLKSGLKAGVALTGGGMKAEIIGPGTFGGSIGKIDKVKGFYQDDKIDTKFATGSIVGSVALGPDFVEATNVTVDGIGLGRTTYKDPPNRELVLGRVLVDKVTLGKVRQNYTKSTEPGKEGEKIPSTLEVEDLVLTGARAHRLVYDGKSEGLTPDGKPAPSTQHIEGRYAYIRRLTISKMLYDKAKAETVMSLKVDREDGSTKRPSFGLRGLTAKLVEQVGAEKTVKHLTTDVLGGPLTAQGIKFTTVKLGTAPGPGGKPADVTRTKIEGEFNLTRLGFINPDLTLTDENGKLTRISGKSHGKVELRGLKPRFMPNGTVRLRLDAVIAKNLQINRGDMTVTIPFAEIKNILLGLKGMGTRKGMDLLAARLGQIHVTGLKLVVTRERKAELTNAEYEEALRKYEEAKKNPSGKLIAEPLSGLSGSAEGEYSLDNWFDPDLKPTIHGGVVGLGGATNYSVMIEKDKLTLGNFKPKKTLLEFGRELPGVYPGRGAHGYGQINIRELVEGLTNAPAEKPERIFEPPAGLKKIRLKGSFALGDGKMGIDKTGDDKLGGGDFWVEFKRGKRNQNTIELVESNLGDMIQLKMPEFHFRGAGFTAGKTQEGKERIGKTGEITLQGINVYVRGLSDFKLSVRLYLRDGVIENVEIGDLTLLNASDLAKLAEPTVTDVNPKGKPVEEEK